MVPRCFQMAGPKGDGEGVEVRLCMEKVECGCVPALDCIALYCKDTAL